MKLFLLFVVVPILELFLLVQLGGLVGAGPTIALVIATALVGSSLARREGLAVWQSIAEKIGVGAPLTETLLDGAIVLASGILLLTPGILTDLVGLAGLVPFTRGFLRPVVKSFLSTRVAARTRYVRPDRSAGHEPSSGWQGQASEKPRHSQSAS